MAGTATLNQIQNQQPNGSAPQQSQAAPQQLVPFIRASVDHVEQGASQVVAGASWATGLNQVFNVPSYGFLAEEWLTVTGSGGSGTATVAASADAPWNLFNLILMKDANGTPIIQLDGWASYLARLLGGYKPYRPDQSAYGYSAIATGANASGNFKFKMELNHMFGPEGWGALPNMDGSAIYTVNATLNGPSVVYSTAPTNPPNLNTLIEMIARSRPGNPDSYGRPVKQDPPAKGTVSYWTSQTFNVVNGNNTLQMNRVGNTIRNIFLLFRDAGGSRANADSTGVTPTSFTLKKDAGVLLQENTDTQRQRNYEAYGFDVPAGVIAFPFTLDPDGTAGHEFGDSYLPTAQSTVLQWIFQSSAAGTLQVITNDLVIAGDLYPAIGGM